MKKHVFLIVLLAFAVTAKAQFNKIFDPNIASLKVTAGDDWQGLPLAVIGETPIHISFDELSHDYHRYSYIIEHCESDWTVTENLFASDFMSGFQDGNIIENAEESEMTYQLYTHYSLTIPNKNCSLTMSGNYCITIVDNNDNNEPVLQAHFMVMERSAGVQLACTTATDMDINGRHQQLSMQTSYGNLRVSNPTEQIKVIILQNRCWMNAVISPKAQYTMRDGQRWEHNRDLIFLGGNEYHKFETLDPTHTTMGLEAVGWDDENEEWHAYVQPDEPRMHYSYDVDANGSFLIRNSDNYNNNTASDYIQTHFELHAPKQNGSVYISGEMTNEALESQYEMIWNDRNSLYELTLPLKQGYYSYKYQVLMPDGTLSHLTTEPSFYETENEYDVLVYFRGTGDRSDRLVGHGHLSTQPNK